MAGPCQVIPGADAFASNMLAFLDCQASALGAGGYQALGSTGGTGAVLLGLLLAIFVAVWGYRLLLGDIPTPRDIVLAAVKVGVVLTLATSWPAYQTLIYDVVLRAPAQVASDIGAPQDLPGANGGLAERLDGVEAAYRRLEILGPGQPRTPAQQAQLRQDTPPPLFGNYDVFALGSARLAFIASALGSFALVRLAAGIMLALGPIFAGLLLFEATRGLFVGWLKGLLALTLAALAIAIVLGVELALLEPWLQQLLAIRASDNPILGVPSQLLAVSLIFAATLAGVMMVVARVASGAGTVVFARVRSLTDERGSALRSFETSMTKGQSSQTEERTRALAIADAITTAQRREARAADHGRVAAFVSRGVATQAGTASGPPALGRSFSRRTSNRVSARAIERDRRA